jgi:hypothetical protein
MKLPSVEQLATKAHEELLLSKRIAGFASWKSPDGDELMVLFEQRAKELFRDEARAWHRLFEVTDAAEG